MRDALHITGVPNGEHGLYGVSESWQVCFGTKAPCSSGQCTLNSACWHPGKQVFCSTWSGSERVFCLKEWVVFWNEWHTMCEEQKKETFTKMRHFKTSRFWNKAHNIHFASYNKMKASLGHIYYSPASHRVSMALSLSSSAFQIQCALRCAWGQRWGCNWAPEDHSPGC